MKKDTYREKRFTLFCHGHNKAGEDVLLQPIEVELLAYRSPAVNTDTFALRAEKCPYVGGSHTNACTADPGKGSCKYSYYYPSRDAISQEVKEAVADTFDIL